MHSGGADRAEGGGQQQAAKQGGGYLARMTVFPAQESGELDDANDPEDQRQPHIGLRGLRLKLLGDDINQGNQADCQVGELGFLHVFTL